MPSARALLLTLLLLPAPFAAAAADAPGVAADGERALRLLRIAAYGGEPQEDPLAAAERVFAASAVPADEARARFAAARGSSEPRRALLEAEAALLALAAANARVADAAAARPWIDLVLARVPADARALPRGGEVNATVDAALALRAREAVVAAVLLRLAGDAAANETAAGAAALLATLVPAASGRLPEGLRTPFEAAVPEAAARIAAVSDPKQWNLSALLAPLAALEYGRDVEMLDEVALRCIDGAFAAARAAEEDPTLAPTLVPAARGQYAADRPFLFLQGEGALDTVDAAFHALGEAADAGASHGAAAAAFAALRSVALLERGIVLKVETGGVQPGRVHIYTVTLVRPPLDGVAAYRISIAYNPAVVRIGEAQPLTLAGEFAANLTHGNATFSGSDAAPARRSVHLATIALTAVGPADSSTPLTVAHAVFLRPNGEAADVFRLRHGSATVARLELEEEEDRDTPAAGPLLAILAGAAAAIARRRRGAFADSA